MPFIKVRTTTTNPRSLWLRTTAIELIEDQSNPGGCRLTTTQGEAYSVSGMTADEMARHISLGESPGVKVIHHPHGVKPGEELT